MSSQLDDDDKAEKTYGFFFADAMHLLEDHDMPVELVAGTMMAIAQRLYKTHLNEDEYEAMMDKVRNANIEPYKKEKVRVH
mgnify:FL=1|jgi:hypothetical protein|tara:strand:+ start:874 stop:1116 length:243 start_codon:yes stop_codon:yes gene_type:complete